MKYITEYLWEQGDRYENEDSIAILQLNVGKTPAILAIVADGIGGFSNGELASAVVTNRLRCAFENSSYNPDNFNIRTLKHILKRELYSCHRELLEYGSQKSCPLGTTISLVCIIKSQGFLINTGDSRIYRFPSGRFHSFLSGSSVRQLTNDNTNDTGRLTSCIGHGQKMQLCYRKFHIRQGDTFLVCSDGFYRRIQPEINNFSHLLKLYPQNHFLNCLYSLAIKRGETDNASAITIQVTK